MFSFCLCQKAETTTEFELKRLKETKTTLFSLKSLVPELIQTVASFVTKIFVFSLSFFVSVK